MPAGDFCVNCDCKMRVCVSYPAVHLSFPPAVVSFLGEDFDSVSLPQRELGAVTRREIIAHFSRAVVAVAHTYTHTHTGLRSCVWCWICVQVLMACAVPAWRVLLCCGEALCSGCLYGVCSLESTSLKHSFSEFS